MSIFVYYEGNNVICSNKKPTDNQEYLELSVLPFGSGKLCTDLKTVWYEDKAKVEVPIEIPIDLKLKAQQERIDFLEDCIVEMAQIIYA